MFKKYTNYKKEVERRSKKYNCDGICYGEKGMCPCAEYCDETRYKEFFGLIFAIIILIIFYLGFLFYCIWFILN